MIAYESSPHHFALGAGALSMKLGVDLVRESALKLLHKFDRYENEARSNEALAQELPIVTIAPA